MPFSNLSALPNRYSKLTLFLVILVISAGFSLLALYVDPILNPDAINYLVTAEIFQNEGYVAAAEEYRRPFYSILIAWIHQLTHLSILNSSHVLNILLISTIVFLLPILTRELGGGQQACLFALLLILLSPSLNNYRAYIIRDFGYWAFTLISLIHLIRYIRFQRIRNAITWALSLLLASVFRPEAAVFILLMPLSVIFLPRSSFAAKLRALSHLYVGPILIAILFIGGLIIFNNDALLYSIKAQLVDESVGQMIAFRNNFLDSVARYRVAFINDFLSDSATLGFLAGILAIFIAKSLSALSPIYSLLFLNGAIHRHYKVPAQALIPLVTMCCLSAAMILVNFINTGFLQSRFTLLIAFLIIALVSLSLEKMYLAADQNSQIRLFRLALIFFSVAIFADGFISFGHSKSYISESVQWVQTNTAQESRLYSNDKIISYLSDRPFDWKLVRNKQQPYNIEKSLRNQKYDYWVIHSKKKDKKLNDWLLTLDEQDIERTTLQNKRGDKVTIYKMTP